MGKHRHAPPVEAAASPEPPLSVYEEQQRIDLEAFRQAQPDLPPGLHHGLWSMQPQYVCDICDAGYLDLDHAIQHLGKHDIQPSPSEPVFEEARAAPVPPHEGKEEAE